MGQADSKSSDFSSFKSISKLDTHILGPVTLMFNPKTHNKIVLRESIFYTNKDFLKNEMLINERERLSHLNVLKVFKYESKEEKQLCSNFYKITQGMEYFGRELSYEIEERRKRNIQFTEKEVEGFIRNMINGLGYLQEKGIVHGSVRTTTIFGENSVYKIIEPGFFRGLPNYTVILSCLMDEKMNVEGVYMAPENLTLIKKNIQVSRVNPFKVDVFALGCIAIEMVTLKNSMELFNYKSLILNVEMMRSRLKETQAKLMNPILFKMIESMVSIDAEKRSDFIGLINFKYQPEPTNILKPNGNLLNRVSMVKNFSKVDQREITPTPENENFSSSKKKMESLKKNKLVLDNDILNQHSAFEIQYKNESVKRNNKIFTKPHQEIKSIDEFMSAKVEKRLNFFDENNFDFKSESKKEEINPKMLDEEDKTKSNIIENLNMQAESNFTIDFSQLNDQNEKQETDNNSKDNSNTDIQFIDDLPKLHNVEEVNFEKSIDLNEKDKVEKQEEKIEKKGDKTSQNDNHSKEDSPLADEGFDDFSKFNFNFESCQPTASAFNIKDFNDFEIFSTNIQNQTSLIEPKKEEPQNKEQKINNKVEENNFSESPPKNAEENIFFSFPNYGSFEIPKTSNDAGTPIFEEQTFQNNPFADKNILKDEIDQKDEKKQNNECKKLVENIIFDLNPNENNEIITKFENFIYSDNFISFENVTNKESKNVTNKESNEKKSPIKQDVCDSPKKEQLEIVHNTLPNVKPDQYFSDIKCEINEISNNPEKEGFVKNASQPQIENFELDNYAFQSPTKIYMIDPEVQKIIDSFKKRETQKNNAEYNFESHLNQENHSNVESYFVPQNLTENCYENQNFCERTFTFETNPSDRTQLKIIDEKSLSNIDVLKNDDSIINYEKPLNLEKNPNDDNLISTHNSLSQMFVSNSENTLILVSESYHDGSIYIGTKKNGFRHGKGKFQYGDGGVFDGDWKEGQIEGEGILYYADGYLAYEGEWKGNRFNGKGLLYNSFPEFKSINYEDFSEMGNGWFKYEGHFVDDVMNGFGKLYFLNGDYFEGNFMNGAIHGNGRFYEKNSAREYIGDWCFNHVLRN